MHVFATVNSLTVLNKISIQHLLALITDLPQRPAVNYEN